MTLCLCVRAPLRAGTQFHHRGTETQRKALQNRLPDPAGPRESAAVIALAIHTHEVLAKLKSDGSGQAATPAPPKQHLFPGLSELWWGRRFRLPEFWKFLESACPTKNPNACVAGADAVACLFRASYGRGSSARRRRQATTRRICSAVMESGSASRSGFSHCTPSRDAASSI